LEQGRQLGRTGIEVNAILGVNAVYVPIVIKELYNKTSYLSRETTFAKLICKYY
jgi:hypothetical protein